MNKRKIKKGAKEGKEIEIKVIVDSIAKDMAYLMDEAMFAWKKPRKYKDTRNLFAKFKDWLNDKIYYIRHKIGEWIADDYFD